MSNSLTLKSSEKAYIAGIAKHLWLKTYRDGAGNIPLDVSDMDQAHQEPLHYAHGKLMSYLETAGQKCMDILKAFYYDQLPVKQISEAFGYSGTHSATVQKYKCLEKVRDTVKQKALHYEDFLE